MIVVTDGSRVVVVVNVSPAAVVVVVVCSATVVVVDVCPASVVVVTAVVVTPAGADPSMAKLFTKQPEYPALITAVEFNIIWSHWGKKIKSVL